MASTAFPNLIQPTIKWTLTTEAVEVMYAFPALIAESLYKGGYSDPAEDILKTDAVVGTAVAVLGRFDGGKSDLLSMGHSSSMCAGCRCGHSMCHFRYVRSESGA